MVLGYGSLGRIDVRDHCLSFLNVATQTVVNADFPLL